MPKQLASVQSDEVTHRQIEGQKHYYARRRPVRLLPSDSPYVRRHFGEAAQAIGLRAGDSVCEWGAGMGRFSLLFAQRKCTVTAIELSTQLAAVCKDGTCNLPQVRIEIGDIIEVSKRLERGYTVVAGFFVLHHLREIGPYFEAARRLLLPEGRLVFVEPNPLNPLYAVQITCTPDMAWRHEVGVYRMWPTTIKRAAEATGFENFTTYRYGALPRAAYNFAARFGVERWAEYITPLPLRAFQVFAARLP